MAALAAALAAGLMASFPAPAQEATVFAAGDIGRCGQSRAEETAALLDGTSGPILLLGDGAYEKGSPRDYRRCFLPSWGRHKERTYPVPGNHDYRSAGAHGYFDFWGAQAGPRDKGHYAVDLGAWQLLALNSSLRETAARDQQRWLDETLATSRKPCILAFWHHPLFSSGRHGNDSRMELAYRRLYAAGATLVLNGHEHLYERFDPQDPEGRKDPKRGIRSFTVGTGGTTLYEFEDIQPNSAFRSNDHWGVLRLTLRPGAYDWAFVTTSGETLDQGQGRCVPRASG